MKTAGETMSFIHGAISRLLQRTSVALKHGGLHLMPTPQETEVGYGRANTWTLLKTANRYYAAKACADYGAKTAYDDWFLPSLDEPALMYTNLKEKDGTWGSESYWSSSGNDNTSAWYVNFSDGDQISAVRTNSKGVRPSELLTGALSMRHGTSLSCQAHRNKAQRSCGAPPKVLSWKPVER